MGAAAGRVLAAFLVTLAGPFAGAILPARVAAASSPAAGSAVRVEYRTSRMFGLLLFASTIADFPNRPGALKDVFLKSSFNTEENRKLIDEFRELHNSLRTNVAFDGFPSSRPHGTTLEQLFAWRALDARDLAELHRTTQGLLPLSRQERYFEILSALERIYDPLIWLPAQDKLEEYRARLESKALDWRVGNLFEQAARFYGAAWPDSLPFTIALYPIPASRGQTSAESAGSLEMVAVLLGEHDLPGRFAVMFHEMCHSLYESEPVAFQTQFESYFTEIKSPYAGLAYALINEALATAIGNGWAYAAAAGHPDNSSWYDDPTIDGFARALFPTVQTYLTTGRTLDRAFVQNSVEIFQQEFPDARNRFEFLFREIILLADGQTIPVADLNHALRARFGISSIFGSSPIDGEESQRDLREHTATVVAAVGADQVEQLGGLKTMFPSLAPRLKELAESSDDAILACTVEGRAVVVMKLRGRDRITAAVGELKRRGQFDLEATGLIAIP
jgi:hypothetical protein